MAYRIRGTENAVMAPRSVPVDAIMNDASSEPHCRNALPRILVPRSNRGVASVNDIVWRKELAVEPPGGSNVVRVHDVVDVDRILVGIQSTLDNANESAMAVTGAPSSLPTVVDLPSSCANEATNESAAMFPHESDCDMMEEMVVEVEDVVIPEREVLEPNLI
jgi:hypothetical protein